VLRQLQPRYRLPRATEAQVGSESIVENVITASVAADSIIMTPTAVSSETPEPVHVPVDGGDVGSSLMHSESSSALEPIINDTNSGSDVTVIPDVSIAADNETPVEPKAKRTKLDTTVSKDSSCASDSTADVTDDEKEDKHDKEFHLDTPSRRSGEFSFGNGAFFSENPKCSISLTKSIRHLAASPKIVAGC